MNYLELLDQVRAHVSILFHKENDDRLVYHNLLHTEHVVKAAVKISNHYKLSDRDFFVVNTAAWFHDSGYLQGFKDHEATGAAEAKEFLTAKAVDPAIIDAVVNCILATQMPQHPVGLLEQIVCDADLFHLGGDQFKEFNKLVRKEAEACLGRDLDKQEWRLKTIYLLEHHHYHTTYCQELLAEGKQRNLAMLKDKVSKEEEERHTTADLAIAPYTIREGTSVQENDQKAYTMKENDSVKGKLDTLNSKKKKSDRPERGIETMFRTTSGNHQRLSDMADNKAHIMISTNSIILSVILSILLRKLEDSPYLIIPTLILLIVCVVTMVFSILATRPSIPEGTFTAEDIRDKKVNLLFFGNFYRMSLPDYAAGMNQMMEDRDFLYGSLVKDLYFQGVVLGRKYRLLRIAYNVFMFGIIAAVLAFVTAAAVVAL